MNNQGAISDKRIEFPIVVKIGDNAIAKWTNDISGGKITITGTGSTYDCIHDKDTVINLLANQLSSYFCSNNVKNRKFLSYIAVLDSMDCFGDTNADDILLLKDIQNQSYTQEEKEIFKIIINELNKIVEVKFEEGITKIGENFLCNTSYINKLILPETLETIGNDAFCETVFKEPIIIPTNVNTIGKVPFYKSKNVTLNMKRTNGDGMILPNNFEIDYTVNWGS